jgi:hypothetical protein
LAPPNRGCFNSTHFRGTRVPVEEPSTASIADIDGEFRSELILKRKLRGAIGAYRRCVFDDGSYRGIATKPC